MHLLRFNSLDSDLNLTNQNCEPPPLAGHVPSAEVAKPLEVLEGNLFQIHLPKKQEGEDMFKCTMLRIPQVF